MCKRSYLFALSAVLGLLLTSAKLTAQGPCPPADVQERPLACFIPQAFGVTGFVDITQPFPDDFLARSLRPLSSSVARQAALLPLASPSSGITFSWNEEAKVFSASTDSFGPIFGERAETVGRHKALAAYNYQRIKFNAIDGIDLGRIPVVFTQPDITLTSFQPFGAKCSIDGIQIPTPPPTFGVTNPDSYHSGGCAFIRNFIRMDNRIDLDVDQHTTFVTFGLTDRIDVSAAIPVERVRLTLSYDATIVLNGTPPNPQNPNSAQHFFPTRRDCPFPCLQRSDSIVGEASGIGDITLRIKGTAWKGERAGFAIGADVRIPSGDELNFLGSGAVGVRPFLIGSYHSRISPHFMVGYQVNGSSLIAGDIVEGTSARLPSEFTYAAGADVWVTNWLTGAFDFIGERVFQSGRIEMTTLSLPDACTTSGCPDSRSTLESTITPSAGDLVISNASIGLKIRPLPNLLVTGHVLIRLNDSGLRADAVPLVGFSYTF